MNNISHCGNIVCAAEESVNASKLNLCADFSRESKSHLCERESAPPYNCFKIAHEVWHIVSVRITVPIMNVVNNRDFKWQDYICPGILNGKWRFGHLKRVSSSTGANWVRVTVDEIHTGYYGHVVLPDHATAKASWRVSIRACYECMSLDVVRRVWPYWYHAEDGDGRLLPYLGCQVPIYL